MHGRGRDGVTRACAGPRPRPARPVARGVIDDGWMAARCAATAARRRRLRPTTAELMAELAVRTAPASCVSSTTACGSTRRRGPLLRRRASHRDGRIGACGVGWRYQTLREGKRTGHVDRVPCRHEVPIVEATVHVMWRGDATRCTSADVGAARRIRARLWGTDRGTWYSRRRGSRSQYHSDRRGDYVGESTTRSPKLSTAPVGTSSVASPGYNNTEGPSRPNARPAATSCGASRALAATAG